MLSEPAADIATAAQAEAPRQLHGAADAYTGTDHNLRRLVRERQPERRLIEAQAVVGSIDRKSLGEVAGSGAKAADVFRAAPLSHPCNAGRRLEGADQNRGTGLRRSADEVQAPMYAVRSINIGDARRSEHRPVPRCGSAKAVGGGIIMPVGFGLDNGPAAAVHVERRADQLPRHHAHIACEKGGKRLRSARDPRDLFSQAPAPPASPRALSSRAR